MRTTYDEVMEAINTTKAAMEEIHYQIPGDGLQTLLETVV